MCLFRRLAVSGRFRMLACENVSISQTCKFRDDFACRHARMGLFRRLAVSGRFRMPAYENQIYRCQKMQIISNPFSHASMRKWFSHAGMREWVRKNCIFLDSITPFEGPIERLFENAPKSFWTYYRHRRKTNDISLDRRDFQLTYGVS
jgi:hypothetical protein